MTTTPTPGAPPAALPASAARGGVFRRKRRLRRLAVVAAVVAAFGVGTANADAAITITRSELNSSQLRVEGSGALPNAAVVVSPGAVSGKSDSSGGFRIESSSYSS